MDDGDQCLWEAIHKKIQIIKTEERESKQNRAGELQKYLGKSLRMVTLKNKLGLVKRLIEEENADPNDKDTDGYDSLKFAVMNGNVSILKYFLSLADKININAHNKYRVTPLHIACDKGFEEMVRILMGNPLLDANTEDYEENTALHTACVRGHEAIVSMLLGHKDIQVNKVNIYMRTPLIAACNNGHLGVVRLLLARDDVDVNAQDINKDTALMISCAKGSIDTVRCLLDHENININLADSNHKTALMLACNFGHNEISKMLLQMQRKDLQKTVSRYGARQVQKYLGRILRMVTKENNLGIVKNLIEEVNADPNDEDIEGFGLNSLMIAAQNGHVSILKYFLSLSDKVNINAQNKCGFTPLLLACCKGFEEVVRILMGNPRLDVNIADKEGRTALYIACISGHEAIVSMLLGHKDIQVNKANINDMTPLIAACQKGHLGVTRLLFATDVVDVNAQNKHKDTALLYACSNGCEEMVRILLKSPQLDVNIASESGMTPLYMACSKGQEAILSMLLGHEDIQVNKANNYMTTPLIAACHKGHLGVVRLLLARDDVNVNAQNKNKHTALMISCNRGSIDIVRCLLDHKGIDINLEDSNDKTALILACDNGKTEIIKILLQRKDLQKTKSRDGAGHLQEYLGKIMIMVTKENNLGLVKKLIEEVNADPNDETIDGINSLMIASCHGYISVLEYFLSLSDKININAQSKLGETPLHFACRKGFEEVVRILMGCPQLDVNIADKEGETALYMACIRGHEAVVSMLLGHEDIQVNKANSKMNTPLYAACSKGYLGVVRLLIARDDVDVNAQNNNKITALMWSCNRGDIEIARCLLDLEEIDVNLEDVDHNTALVLACDYDKPEIISMLLQREDLQRTPRNLVVIIDFVMKLIRVKDKTLRTIIETAVSRNLPNIAVWLLKFEGSRNFGPSFYQGLLAKASKYRHDGLVEYINDQKLAEEVNHLDVNNTEVMLIKGISDKKEESNPKSKNRKKRRKKVRPFESETQIIQNREISDSISEDVSVAPNSDDPSTIGAAALEVASSAETSSQTPSEIEISRTPSDSISEDLSIAEESSSRSDSRIIRGAEALEAASPSEASSVTLKTPTPFEIDEWGPHDKTLEETNYRDKVKSMIAAKARAEWDDKMKDLDKLQEEKEELQEKIRVKEKQFDAHKVKFTEMIDDTAKKMTNYISVISKTEDERAEIDKEFKKLEERQRECDAQIEKMERKKKGLEKFMETEMSNMKAEKSAIIEDIERLNKALRSNIKATEDLARFIFQFLLLLKACIFQDGCC